MISEFHDSPSGTLPVWARPATMLTIAVVLFVSLSLLMFANYRDRLAGAVEAAKRQSATVARAIEEQTATVVLVADHELREATQGNTVEALVNGPPNPELTQSWRNAIAGIPFVLFISSVNADGWSYQSTTHSDTPTFKVGDRDYFRFHRDNPSLETRFGSVLKSIRAGKLVITLTHRLNAADGSFAGVMLAGIDPGYFRKFFDVVRGHPDDAIGLYARDGTLLLASAGEGREAPAVDASLFSRRLAEAPDGAYEERGGDGVDRVYVYHTFQGMPLVVTIGSTRAAATAEARRAAPFYLVIAVTLGAALIALAALARQSAQRRLIAQRFKKGEERYRGLVDTQCDLVVRLDRRGRFTFVNEATATVLGLPRAEVLSRTWDGFVHAEDRAATAEVIAAALTAPHPRVRVENRVLTADGPRWYAWEGFSVGEDNGQRLEVQAVGRDISDRRRAEDERRDQILFLRSLLEAIPALVFYKDAAGRYLGCNSGFAAAFGLDAGTLAGRTIGNLVCDEETRKIFRDSDRRLFAERRPHTYDFTVPRDDGGTRHLRAYKAPFLKADGSLGGLIGIMLDITADIKREEELRAARQAADVANRAKSEFLANMSHEIRTPMNAILGLIYLLDQSELSVVQRDYVHKTRVSAQSLLGILNDILDFSKVEAGRLELERVPFQLDETMKTLATIVSANTRHKDIEVLFRIDPATPLALVGDPLRLQQVLLNLAGNAIKFTETGEVELTVAPTDAATDDGIELAFTVRDTGIGIGAEQREHLFEAFGQADSSTSRRFGGTGLGLAISRRLVDLMGGTIGVVSEPGHGSTFRFTARFGHGAEEERPPLRHADLARPLRILVVDDNATARDVLAAMVGRFGWDCTVAGSGREALAAIDRSTAEEGRFDLVLLDWRMPEIGGQEVLDHIHARYPADAMPVILVVTAYEQDRVRREAGGESAIKMILTKPVTPSVLLDAVAAVCTAAAGQAPAPAPVADSTLRGCRLLLVEDNAINQTVGRCLLEGAGGTVETADSGVEALRLLAAAPERFDAVLMDVQMPGMDGYETTRAIRKELGLTRLPVIAMTANVLPADRERCLAAGMNDHVAKPVDPGHLISVTALWTRRTHPEPAETPAGDAAPPATGPGLDLAVALRSVAGDRELLRAVMGEFVALFGSGAGDLRQALAGDDFGTLVRLAHDLKSVAGAIGAHALAADAAELQAAARSGDRHLAAAQGAATIRDLEEALAGIGAALREPAAGPETLAS